MSVSLTNSESPVDDFEALYRAVHNDPRYFPLDADGRRRVSSIAFNDAARRPSVDRAVLCPAGALDTQRRFSPGSGVLSLITRDVRKLTTTHHTSGKVYAVDVEPVPLPENPAHAEIFGRPPFDTDRVFDRIKQALARLATVVIPPGSGAVT